MVHSQSQSVEVAAREVQVRYKERALHWRVLYRWNQRPRGGGGPVLGEGLDSLAEAVSSLTLL